MDFDNSRSLIEFNRFALFWMNSNCRINFCGSLCQYLSQWGEVTLGMGLHDVRVDAVPQH